MGEKSQINLWVENVQKERWEDYLKDSGHYTTLSSLIRASVETHIASEDNSQPNASPALLSDIDNLREELSRVRKDVSWLRTQHQDNVDISGLAQEVFTYLEPLAESQQPVTVPDEIESDPEDYRNFLAAQPIITPNDEEEMESEGNPSYTAKAIADELGTTKERVEDALEHLRDQFLPVVQVEIDGATHYFREAE